MIPVQGMRNSPHLDFAGELRDITRFPTFHAGKIPDLATARHAIASGKLDMVGMTRAHLADPHIVRKLKASQEQAIRPCVGATYCLDRIYQGGEAYCIHNPASGRELTMPHTLNKAAVKKRIVIVGAGLAGLEAARVAAERGHDVHVLEADNQAGGKIRLTALSPKRREMISIVEWRLTQCEKHGVQFRFNCWAETEEVLALDPQVVIIATGGLPNTEILHQGNELVASTWDILAGSIKPAQKVLLYDDAGDHAALQAAEVIVASGAELEIMTPDRSFAPDVMGMNLVPYLRNLQTCNVKFTVTYRLLAVEKTAQGFTAIIGSDYGAWQQRQDYDQIIVNHGTRPLDDLYFDLKPRSKNLGAVHYDQLIAGQPQMVIKNPEGRFLLYRIGDAVAARNTHAAIYDALRLMKDI